MEFLGRYLFALLLTVAVEGGVAWLFGYRTARLLLAVVMINCLTNPALNLLLLVLAWRGVEVTLFLVVLLEVLVVAVEWRLLDSVIGGPKGRMFFLSLAANTASFLVGLLIFGR